MAPKPTLAVLAIIAAALPFAMATDYIVGDGEGWNPKTNYTSWAAGKMFMVGDTLVFNYEPGKHNVIPVGGVEFKACNANQSNKVFSSGSDRLTLQTAGRKWYLCGKANHCELGQKLVITVMEDIPSPPSPSPSPVPPSSVPPPPSNLGIRIVFSKYQMLVAAAAVAAAFFMA